MKYSSALSTLALVVSARVADADDDDARRRYAEASAAYERGEYADAATLFEQAYSTAPAPSVLFNIAQAYRRAGNCVDAQRRFRDYLATSPDAAGAAVATEHLAAPCIQAPSEPASVAAPRASTSTAVSVQAQQPAPSQQARWLRIGGASVGIAGVATLITGGVFFASGDLTTACVDHCDRPLGDQKLETTRSNGTASTILLVGGGGLVATGIGLYVWGHLTRAPAPVEITPVTGGAVIGSTWIF